MMPTREQMEIDICAINVPLKDTVQSMDIMTLLRNCHPAYRTDYARTLHKENVITEEEMKEFTITKR